MPEDVYVAVFASDVDGQFKIARAADAFTDGEEAIDHLEFERMEEIATFLAPGLDRSARLRVLNASIGGGILIPLREWEEAKRRFTS